MGVIFENIRLNSNNTNSTDHDNSTHTYVVVTKRLNLHNDKGQNPVASNLDDSKSKVADAKFNDAKMGAYCNEVKSE